ncbi:hypothetical protein A2U01_0104839, partial [Trifolium medium]|nr:hypothetical protein [Trifolium medium]
FGNGGIDILPSSGSLTIMLANSLTLVRRFLKLALLSCSHELPLLLALALLLHFSWNCNL